MRGVDMAGQVGRLGSVGPAPRVRDDTGAIFFLGIILGPAPRRRGRRVLASAPHRPFEAARVGGDDFVFSGWRVTTGGAAPRARR